MMIRILVTRYNCDRKVRDDGPFILVGEPGCGHKPAHFHENEDALLTFTNQDSGKPVQGTPWQQENA